MRRLWQPGHPSQPRVGVDLAQIGPAGTDHPAARCGEPEQYAQNGGLAGTARAGEHHDLAGLDRERKAGQGGRIPVRVAHGDPVHFQDAGRRRGRGAASRYGCLQHGEDLLRRSQALRTRVIVAAERPQRQVRLRRQNEDQQRSPQVERASHEPQPDADGDQRHRQRGQQLQHQAGQKRESQAPHGQASILLGDVRDRGGLHPSTAEDAQRRQAGHHIEEVVGQPPHLTKLAPVGLSRPHPNQRHENGDQR